MNEKYRIFKVLANDIVSIQERSLREITNRNVSVGRRNTWKLSALFVVIRLQWPDCPVKRLDYRNKQAKFIRELQWVDSAKI